MRPESSQTIDWLPGEHFGLAMPLHPRALDEGGASFLTRAMRAAGSLQDDNAVVDILNSTVCSAGSTGQKLMLSLAYTKSQAGLAEQVFVKFSRDFGDPIRDQARFQLEAEVKLGLLSRSDQFPIVVPVCLYGDYHSGSGSGLLISECIGFGQGGIEPLYEKCLDHDVPNLLDHYQCIVQALARLAAAHKSGGLGSRVEGLFPYAAEQSSLAAPIRYSKEQLSRRLEKLQRFATGFPNMISPEQFPLAALRESVSQILAQESVIKAELLAGNDYTALLHWNANIDNAWFYRDGRGRLQCGLFDWGGVCQMNMGLALWGALSAAHDDIWTLHLDELIVLFAAEFEQRGGGVLEPEVLRRQLCLSGVMMGLSWLLDAPALIARAAPNLSAQSGRFDEAILSSEMARTQLQMLLNFLRLWRMALDDYL